MRGNGDKGTSTERGYSSVFSSNSAEFACELIHSIKRLHEMGERQMLVPANSQRIRSPRRILDLPSINILLRKLYQPLFLEFRLSTIQWWYSDFDAYFGEECAPDLGFGGLREFLEVEGDVDTGEEGFVECFDAVGGEEEDAAVVFDVAEEDGDHGVSFEVVKGTLFQEDVSLEKFEC